MSFTVDVEWMDGKRETFDNVTDVELANDVLTLTRSRWMDGMGRFDQVLGQFPVGNIRRWVPRDA